MFISIGLTNLVSFQSWISFFLSGLVQLSLSTRGRPISLSLLRSTLRKSIRLFFCISFVGKLHFCQFHQLTCHSFSPSSTGHTFPNQSMRLLVHCFTVTYLSQGSVISVAVRPSLARWLLSYYDSKSVDHSMSSSFLENRFFFW